MHEVREQQQLIGKSIAPTLARLEPGRETCPQTLVEISVNDRLDLGSLQGKPPFDCGAYCAIIPGRPKIRTDQPVRECDWTGW